jgi:hypothetical protein
VTLIVFCKERCAPETSTQNISESLGRVNEFGFRVIMESKRRSCPWTVRSPKDIDGLADNDNFDSERRLI